MPIYQSPNLAIDAAVDGVLEQHNIDVATLQAAIAIANGEIDVNESSIIANAEAAQQISDNLQTLSTVVNTNAGDIDAVEAAVSALQSSVATNDAQLRVDIDSNTAAIAAANANIATNAADISTVEARVAANETDIANLNTATNVNASGIAVNASDIDALEVAVSNINVDSSALEGRVSQNETDIAANTVAISTVDGRVDAILQGSSESLDTLIEVVQAYEAADSNINAALAAQAAQSVLDDAGLQAQIDALEGSSTAATDALDVRVTAAEANIVSNDTDIADLQARADETDNEIAIVSNDISVIEQDVASLDTRVTTNEADIDAIETAIVNANTDVSDLAARVTVNESDIDNLENNVAINAVTIQSNTALINGLDTRLTTAESDIDALEAKDIAVDADIATLAGRITSNDGDIAALDTRVSTNEADILALQGSVGGIDLSGIATNAADIDALEARATTLESDVSINEVAIGANASDIYKLENQANVVETTIYEDNAAVYADGSAGTEDATLREGWYYTNGANPDKINWYFFSAQQSIQTLGDFSGYAVMTFDDASQFPILNVYTVATGTNDASSWYHSRKTYSVMSETPVVGTKYVVYFGAEPDVYPALPRISLGVSTVSTVGELGDNEVVLTSSFGTNSIAPEGSVQFLVESLGVNTPTFKTQVNLRIHRASQADVDLIEGRVTQNDIDIVALQSDMTTAQNDIVANASDIATNASDISVLQTTVSNLGGDVASIDLTGITDNANAIDAIDTRLLTAEQNIVLNDLDINNLQAKDVSLDGDVANLQSQIDSNDVDIAALQAKDTSLDSDIASLQSQINSTNTDVAVAEGRLDNIDTTLGTYNTRIVSNDNDIAVLDGRIDAILAGTTTDFDTFVEVVNAFQSADSTLQGTLTQLTTDSQTADAALQAQIDTNAADIVTNANNIATNAANIASNDTDILNLQAQIATLDGDVASIDLSGITTNANDIAALDVRVTANEGNITTNSTDIATNVSDIAALDTRVTTAEADIVTNAGDIQTVADNLATEIATTDSEISALQGRVTVNESDIAALETSVTGIDTSIANNATDISSLQSRMTSAEGNISSNDTDIAALQTRATALETGLASEIATTDGDIAALDTRISTNETDILALQGTVGAVELSGITDNANAISALDVRVTANEGNITTNATDIATNASDISALQTTVAGKATTTYVDGQIAIVNNTIDSEVATLEGSIASQAVQIVGLQGQINSNDSDISALDTRVSQNETDIATLQTDLLGIDTGSLQTQIDANAADIDTNTAAILVVEADVAALQAGDVSGQVATNTSDIATNATAISGLDTRVTAAEADIDQIQLDIAGISGSQITQNTTDISTNASDISALNTRVTTNEADIVQLQSDVAAIDTSTFQTQIDANASDITTLSNSLAVEIATTDSEINAINSTIAAIDTSGIATNATAISNLETSVAALPDTTYVDAGDSASVATANAYTDAAIAAAPAGTELPVGFAGLFNEAPSSDWLALDGTTGYSADDYPDLAGTNGFDITYGEAEITGITNAQNILGLGSGFERGPVLSYNETYIAIFDSTGGSVYTSTNGTNWTTHTINSRHVLPYGADKPNSFACLANVSTTPEWFELDASTGTITSLGGGFFADQGSYDPYTGASAYATDGQGTYFVIKESLSETTFFWNTTPYDFTSFVQVNAGQILNSVTYCNGKFYISQGGTGDYLFVYEKNGTSLTSSQLTISPSSGERYFVNSDGHRYLAVISFLGTVTMIQTMYDTVNDTWTQIADTGSGATGWNEAWIFVKGTWNESNQSGLWLQRATSNETNIIYSLDNFATFNTTPNVTIAGSNIGFGAALIGAKVVCGGWFATGEPIILDAELSGGITIDNFVDYAITDSPSNDWFFQKSYSGEYIAMIEKTTSGDFYISSDDGDTWTKVADTDFVVALGDEDGGHCFLYWVGAAIYKYNASTDTSTLITASSGVDPVEGASDPYFGVNSVSHDGAGTVAIALRTNSSTGIRFNTTPYDYSSFTSIAHGAPVTSITFENGSLFAGSTTYHLRRYDDLQSGSTAYTNIYLSTSDAYDSILSSSGGKVVISSSSFNSEVWLYDTATDTYSEITSSLGIDAADVIKGRGNTWSSIDGIDGGFVRLGTTATAIYYTTDGFATVNKVDNTNSVALGYSSVYSETLGVIMGPRMSNDYAPVGNYRATVTVDPLPAFFDVPDVSGVAPFSYYVKAQ